MNSDTLKKIVFVVIVLLVMKQQGCELPVWVPGPVIPGPVTPPAPVAKAPFKTDKLAGLIVYDASPQGILALSKGQRDVIEGNSETSVKEFFRKNGGYELQTLDKENTNVDLSYPWMKEARLVEMKSYPWMVVATPTSGDSFALPADVTMDSVTAKLQRIVGAKAGEK